MPWMPRLQSATRLPWSIRWPATSAAAASWTLRQPNGHRPVFLDFRERAPLSATATMFQDADGKVVPGLSERGWKAVGVPGSVLGFETALRDYGSLPRATVMAPAIGLARDGIRAWPRRRRAAGHDHRRLQGGSCLTPGIPAAGRHPVAGRRPAYPGRPRPHPGGDQRAWSAGILRWPHGARDRGCQQAAPAACSRCATSPPTRCARSSR